MNDIRRLGVTAPSPWCRGENRASAANVSQDSRLCDNSAALPIRWKRALQWLGRLYLALTAHNSFETAAAIAFWFFLSLVPLLVLLGWLVGQFARSRGVDTLVTPLLEVIPDTAEDIVRKELERMASGTTGVAPLGVIGYFWTASSGLHNLMDVFETAARVVRRRPWWLQRVIALGWVIAGLAAACLLAWSLVRVDAALHRGDPPSRPTAAAVASGGAPGPGTSTASGRTALARAHGALNHRVHAALHTPLEEAIASGLMLVVGLALLAGFYRFAVDHPPDVERRFWPGAITAVACWLAVSWVFGIYAVSMASYALYYGSLAAVAVMLIWLYLTSLSLVVGAEVNAMLERGDAAPPTSRRR
jgi:membrane protein